MVMASSKAPDLQAQAFGCLHVLAVPVPVRHSAELRARSAQAPDQPPPYLGYGPRPNVSGVTPSRDQER